MMKGGEILTVFKAVRCPHGGSMAVGDNLHMRKNVKKA